MSERDDAGPAARWAGEVAAAVADLRGGLADRLRGLASCPDDTPAARVAALHRVWRLFGGVGAEGSAAGGVEAVRSAADRAVGMYLSDVAAGAARQLPGLFAAGHNDPREPVVSWDALAPRDRLEFGQMFNLPVAGCPVAALPAGHPVHAALEAAGVGGGYRPAGAAPAVLLGPAGHRWFLVRDAARLTAEVEIPRRAKEESDRRGRELRERADRLAWEQSPAGQAARLARLEAELAARPAAPPG